MHQFAGVLERARRVGQQVVQLGAVAVELAAQGLVMARQIAVEVVGAFEQPARFRAGALAAVAIRSSFLISVTREGTASIRSSMSFI